MTTSAFSYERSKRFRVCVDMPRGSFVPSFFAVLQRLEERRLAARKKAEPLRTPTGSGAAQAG
jgi:hypothetical protein